MPTVRKALQNIPIGDKRYMKLCILGGHAQVSGPGTRPQWLKYDHVKDDGTVIPGGEQTRESWVELPTTAPPGEPFVLESVHPNDIEYNRNYLVRRGPDWIVLKTPFKLSDEERAMLSSQIERGPLEKSDLRDSLIKRELLEAVKLSFIDTPMDGLDVVYRTTVNGRICLKHALVDLNLYDDQSDIFTIQAGDLLYYLGRR